MASITGIVNYSSLIPYSLQGRQAFDGSVPYCVNTSSFLYQSSGDGNWVSTVFVMVGQPANASNEVGDAATLVGVQKQFMARLTDMYVKGGVGCDFYRVQITVCDPGSAFPTSDDHVYLYDSIIVPGDGDLVRIPDISGIVVAASSGAPLNVCVKISFKTKAAGSSSVSFHGVAIIDD